MLSAAPAHNSEAAGRNALGGHQTRRTNVVPSHIFIQLASPDRERLHAFYRDVIQLPPRENMGPDNFALATDTTLAIVDHSDVSGPARDPARIMLDLWVDDIESEQAKLEAAGVNFTRNKGLEFWGGIISTFNDSDGNTVQLIQYKPELAQLPQEAPAGVA
jgi:predicted enzyme related to lactoylglutathione lyase